MKITYQTHYRSNREGGLSAEGYFEFTNTDAPDHSYRQEPSIRLLKKAIFKEKNN